MMTLWNKHHCTWAPTTQCAQCHGTPRTRPWCFCACSRAKKKLSRRVMRAATTSNDRRRRMMPRRAPRCCRCTSRLIIAAQLACIHSSSVYRSIVRVKARMRRAVLTPRPVLTAAIAQYATNPATHSTAHTSAPDGAPSRSPGENSNAPSHSLSNSRPHSIRCP
jgi:hypothetical protein